MLTMALTLLVLALELGATLVVALCDSFSRQGKLLRILMIVAIPVLGALVALRMVYVSAGAPAPPSTAATPSLDVVHTAVVDATTAVAKHLASSPDGR